MPEPIRPPKGQDVRDRARALITDSWQSQVNLSFFFGPYGLDCVCASLDGLRERRYQAVQRCRLFPVTDFGSGDRLGSTKTVPAGGLPRKRGAGRALDGMVYSDICLTAMER